MVATRFEYETKLIDFVLVSDPDIQRLNERVREYIDSGYDLQGKPYHYVPDDGSNRVSHVVPMALYRKVLI